MSHSGNVIGQRLVLAPKAQNVWGVSHAIWFWAMGIGGALYLLRFLFGVRLGAWFGLEVADLLGMVLVGGGGLILISDLGQPLRFWRALARPTTSWISVGALADFVFLVCEVLVLLPELEIGGSHPLGSLPLGPGSALGLILQVLAAIAAFVVIIYPGLVLAASPSIPFWNNALVPLQFLSFAFATGAGLGFGVLSLSGATAAMVGRLVLIAMASLAITMLFVVGHLLAAHMQRSTARASVRLLVRGSLSTMAWSGLLLGLVVPLLVVGLALAGGSSLGWLALSGLLVCAGNLIFKLVVLKAGLYPPIF